MKLSTRLILAMVSLVLLTASTVGWLTYRNIESLMLPRSLGGLQMRARLLATELETSVRSARADATAFRSAVALEGIVQASIAGDTDPASGRTLATWRERLGTRFAS